MDINYPYLTLSSSSSTRTFTISYTGNVTYIQVILNAVSAVYTFPVNSLCMNSDGTKSGGITCTLSGTSGDRYKIGIQKFGSNYDVVAVNMNR